MSNVRHASPPASHRASVAETSLAERARTLVTLRRIGTLATQSRKQPGFPFGSVMPYARRRCRAVPSFSSAAWPCTRRT